MLGITYAPLPEREAYLKRIGYSGGTEPTLDNLHALIRAHQTAVPFENLDCVSRTPILLEVERLFDKIVLRRRGGYCFELNGLFMALLRDLGAVHRKLSGTVALPKGDIWWDPLRSELRGKIGAWFAEE